MNDSQNTPKPSPCFTVFIPASIRAELIKIAAMTKIAIGIKPALPKIPENNGEKYGTLTAAIVDFDTHMPEPIKVGGIAFWKTSFYQVGECEPSVIIFFSKEQLKEFERKFTSGDNPINIITEYSPIEAQVAESLGPDIASVFASLPLQ